jgi:hypothetical protein
MDWLVKLRKDSKVDDVSRALADPFTRARVDALIEHFRIRGVRMLPLDIIAALIEAGLHADAAKILAEAVVARIEERVSPADGLALMIGRPRAGPVAREASSKER